MLTLGHVAPWLLQTACDCAEAGKAGAQLCFSCILSTSGSLLMQAVCQLHVLPGTTATTYTIASGEPSQHGAQKSDLTVR